MALIRSGSPTCNIMINLSWYKLAEHGAFKHIIGGLLLGQILLDICMME